MPLILRAKSGQYIRAADCTYNSSWYRSCNYSKHTWTWFMAVHGLPYKRTPFCLIG